MVKSITHSESWIEKNRVALLERNEARRVAGQMYRRALKAEKDLVNYKYTAAAVDKLVAERDELGQRLANEMIDNAALKALLDETTKERDEQLAAANALPETCKWKDRTTCYVAGCCDTAIDADFPFCPYCGRRIEVVE